jgi:NTP pyrophosphatase (non-canonical NTP hydrolase)
VHDIKAELGDCLWYIAVLADDFGLKLEDIAEHNLKKLASRQKRGTLTGSGDHR